MRQAILKDGLQKKLGTSEDAATKEEFLKRFF